MEMIAAKTPEMVLKDIWMHLLAYNLLRTLMWQSPQHAQVSPLRLSLQGKAGFRGEASPETLRLDNSSISLDLSSLRHLSESGNGSM